MSTAKRRANKNWYERNAARVLKRQREKDIHNPEKKLLGAARQRARRLGLPFNLVLSDITIPAVCPVLGISLTLDNTCADRESAPSLDRLIPALGYISGNVEVISYRANRIKNDATLAEIKAVAKYMESR